MIPRIRLGLYMWLAGTVGIVVLLAAVIPQLVAETPLSLPVGLVFLASAAQSALLVALAVWLGVLLAPRVGLQAAAFEAAVSGGSITAALRPQLVPAIVGGLLGGIALFLIGRYASPASLAEADLQFDLPILARVLYGGITEELLLRWGLMTVMVWLAWRFLQRRNGSPRPAYVWLAIVLSALIFGAGHLPAVVAMVGELTTDIVLFIVAANSAFGVLFGYLYWRYGLESAMIAHAMSHIVNYAFIALVFGAS